MQRWEYVDVRLDLDRKRNAFVAEATTSGSELVGRSAVYAHYAGDGWELIAVVAESYGALAEATRGKSPGPGWAQDGVTTFVTEWGVIAYRFFFKRPKAD